MSPHSPEIKPTFLSFSKEASELEQERMNQSTEDILQGAERGALLSISATFKQASHKEIKNGISFPRLGPFPPCIIDVYNKRIVSSEYPDVTEKLTSSLSAPRIEPLLGFMNPETIQKICSSNPQYSSNSQEKQIQTGWRKSINRLWELALKHIEFLPQDIIATIGETPGQTPTEEFIQLFYDQTFGAKQYTISETALWQEIDAASSLSSISQLHYLKNPLHELAQKVEQKQFQSPDSLSEQQQQEAPQTENTDRYSRAEQRVKEFVRELGLEGIQAQAEARYKELDDQISGLRGELITLSNQIKQKQDQVTPDTIKSSGIKLKKLPSNPDIDALRNQFTEKKDEMEGLDSERKRNQKLYFNIAQATSKLADTMTLTEVPPPALTYFKAYLSQFMERERTKDELRVLAGIEPERVIPETYIDLNDPQVVEKYAVLFGVSDIKAKLEHEHTEALDRLIGKAADEIVKEIDKMRTKYGTQCAIAISDRREDYGKVTEGNEKIVFWEDPGDTVTLEYLIQELKAMNIPLERKLNESGKELDNGPVVRIGHTGAIMLISGRSHTERRQYLTLDEAKVEVPKLKSQSVFISSQMMWNAKHAARIWELMGFKTTEGVKRHDYSLLHGQNQYYFELTKKVLPYKVIKRIYNEDSTATSVTTSAYSKEEYMVRAHVDTPWNVSVEYYRSQFSVKTSEISDDPSDSSDTWSNWGDMWD